MTYKENAEKYIENYGLSIGDTIKVNKEDITYTGILLDRPEDADDGYLVLKLSSGYNIGVAIKDAYEPSPGSIPVTPIFLSEEEADLEVASWRAELRDLVNSEMEEEENDPDDGSSVESTSGESSAESGTSSSDESSSQGSDIAS